MKRKPSKILTDSQMTEIAFRKIDHAIKEAASLERFRGEIYDYARTFELGTGYKIPSGTVCRNCAKLGMAECRHFEIETARQLIGPFKAIRDPNVRTMMLLKATQNMGSFCWDMSLHYLIVHSQYTKIIVYLESEEKALGYSKRRLMPTLKANPDIAKLLPTGGARFNDTFTEIIFTNGKMIKVCSLNESNTASETWEVVIIDEGWLSGTTGLMQRAVDRAKQVADKKIIIIGQAGSQDEDQHKFWERLNKIVPLTFACPCCGGRQKFEITRQRPDDYQPLPILNKVIAGILIPAEPPKPGTYCGLKVEKRFSDITDPTEMKSIAALTVNECEFCGCQMPDTPALRKLIASTYDQDYQVAGVTPEGFDVGFWNPDPASITIPYAETMLAYMQAKIAQEKLGNINPLKEFYINRWATAWSQDMSGRAPERIGATIYDIDPDKKIEEGTVRISSIDFQLNGTHLPYQAWEIGKDLRPKLLHCEWIKPSIEGLSDSEAREFCKARARELNKQWKIENQNCMIDSAHRPDLVLEWCAEDAVLARIKDNYGRPAMKWISYGALVGDERASYKWSHPGRAPTFARFSLYTWTYVEAIKDGRRVKIAIHRRMWSNPSIKEIAQRFRDGDSAPKIEVHEKFLRDTTKNGFWAQMNSEHLVPWKGRPGKMRWDNEGRPNHFFDCFCQMVVRMDELGMLVFAGNPQSEDAT